MINAIVHSVGIVAMRAQENISHVEHQDRHRQKCSTAVANCPLMETQ